MKTLWLLGKSVSQSFSIPMQNAAFAAAKLGWQYRPYELDQHELDAAIRDLRQSDDVVGANVTIPCKEAVIPFLDELDHLARRIGAVNTVSRRNGNLRGSNTDVEGFRCAIQECGYDVEAKPVFIIGAGGAARAVAEALRGAVSHLTIAARDRGRARGLITELHLEGADDGDLDWSAPTFHGAAVIINATPADLPPSGLALRSDQRVFDLRSRRSAEGRSMLLHQGAAAFELWTGRQAPIEAMRQALNQAAEAVRA